MIGEHPQYRNCCVLHCSVVSAVALTTPRPFHIFQEVNLRQKETVEQNALTSETPDQHNVA